MLRGRDYSSLKIGTKLEGGDIQTCIHCGRTALRQEVYKKEWFTHSHYEGFSEDTGDPLILWDMCPDWKTALKINPGKTPLG